MYFLTCLQLVDIILDLHINWLIYLTFFRLVIRIVLHKSCLIVCSHYNVLLIKVSTVPFKKDLAKCM